MKMKKWMTSLVLAVFFLSMITTSHASYDGRMLSEFPRNSVLYQNVKEKSARQYLNNIIILPEASFDHNQAEGMIGRIGSLPVSMLQKINRDGIYIKLFNGQLTDNPTAKYLNGVVPRGYPNNKTTWNDVPGMGGSKLVLVKIGSSEKGKGHSSVNLELHELAHSIDRYVYNGIRSNADFLAIWNKEKTALFPGNPYFLDYPEEYFAECFAMYYLGPHTKTILKDKAPETYKYIKSLR